MDAAAEMRRFAELSDIYAALSAQYIRAGVNTVRDPEDKENTRTGGAHDTQYLSIGCSALRIVTQALLGNLRAPPASILDFPSGSGRVTRHFRAMFPEARIGACDLYRHHVEFCAKHFGAEPILSKENPDDLDLGPAWDLVFCGSLLTHLPENLFWPTIHFIARSLSPQGIAVVTLEGRHAEHIQDHKWKLIADDLFDVARESFHGSGFGFVDYQHDFKQRFPDQERYGVALTRPSWLMKGLETRQDIRILGFTERDWDDHQDVVVFGRPGVNE